MRWSRLAAIGVACILAGFLGGTSAWGQTPGAVASYQSPLVIPAAAFVNDGVDPDGASLQNGAIVGTGVRVHMVAPVYLPDGATVDLFRAYIYDNDDVCELNGEDVEIFLVRTSLVDGTAETVAIATSEGRSSFVQLVPTHTLYTSRATINNTSYQYWIEMRICSASHRMSSVVIGY